MPELSAYPTDTTRFNQYGVSIVGGTGAGIERVGTLFTAATPSVTFTPTYATPDATSIVELWQPGLNATLVNSYITAAIDLIIEEALKEWSTQALAVVNGQVNYPLPTGAKFLHTVSYLKLSPIAGHPFSNTTTFRGLSDDSSRAKLGQSFTLGADALVRGVSLYLRKVGTLAAATLTATLYTDSASAPSAAITGATGTISTDVVTTDGSFFFFDFARPVNFTAGTTYWIVLTTSGGVDASNYIQWAEDGSNEYANGNLVTGTSVPAWTTVSGSDVIFHIVPWSADWVDLEGYQWMVQTDASKTFIRIIGELGQWLPVSELSTQVAIAEGTPLRIVGWGKAARPSSDTADLEVPRAFVEAKARALMLPEIDPMLMPIAQYWDQRAEMELRNHPVKSMLRPNAVLVSEL